VQERPFYADEPAQTKVVPISQIGKSKPAEEE
jgi:hypothetical protein